ncbi:MAG: ATP-binding protein, partial [Terriglobia bacterium]
LVADSWLRLGLSDQAVLLVDTLNIYGTLHVQADTGRRVPNDTRLWQLPAHAARVRYLAPEGTRPMIAAESQRLTIDPAWLTLEDWCGFFDVDPFADPLGHLLAILLDAAKQVWQADPHRKESPSQQSGIHDLLQALDQHPDAQHFEDSTREALRRRLMALDRFDVFRRPSPGVEELLTPGMVTVCQLRDLDDRLRALVVAVLVREIMRARARADANSRLMAARSKMGKTSEAATSFSTSLPRCWIAIDEAHNYLPSSGSLPSRPVLRRLITEGRNIGLSVIVATQQPSGLDSSIQRNADTLLIHSMSMRDDISAAEGMVNAQVPDSASWGTAEKASGRVFEKVVRALPQGYCLVSTDTANRVFGLCVRPRLTMHGGETY